MESKDVMPGIPVSVRRMGEKMVLWRDTQGKLACVSDLCPHRGVALSVGKVLGDCIQCPFHGFQYDKTGACTIIPANGKNAAIPKAMHVRSYPVKEAHDFIYLWWGEPREDLPPLPWFDSIDESFSYGTIIDPWATHYSRAIENQLDVVHLPFIHRNTIGRGNRTLVNGPVARLVPQEGNSDIINLWVNNEVDHGQQPRRASDLPEPERHPFLQFRFPNIWHNWISDSFRIVAAFVPLNNENTLLILRGYQNRVRIPLLREITNLVYSIGNVVIERQDKEVVITQLPKPSGLHIGEMMIPGDGPIVLYRRRREELQKEGSLQEKISGDISQVNGVQ
jgi:phenylpropionate dioxygenase-like ring-hydroxylating dioxygenase large terminal subunit